MSRSRGIARFQFILRPRRSVLCDTFEPHRTGANYLESANQVLLLACIRHTFYFLLFFFFFSETAEGPWTSFCYVSDLSSFRF